MPANSRLTNGYNTAMTFTINLTFANGNRMVVQDGPDNGIWIEGEEGKIFVNRGRLTGKPIEEIESSRDRQGLAG